MRLLQEVRGHGVKVFRLQKKDKCAGIAGAIGIHHRSGRPEQQDHHTLLIVIPIIIQLSAEILYSERKRFVRTAIFTLFSSRFPATSQRLIQRNLLVELPKTRGDQRLLRGIQ